MLELFDAIVNARFGYGAEECGGERAQYVYLDDGIFACE